MRVSFVWQGNRRRETLSVDVTPANIKYAGKLVASIELAIEKGTFDYAATFPNSKFAKNQNKENQKRRHKVGALILQYIDTARQLGSLSPSTISSYSRWYSSRLANQFAETWLDELTPFDLRAWINTLPAELSNKSVRNCVGVLSVVLRQAYLDGLISSNPLDPINLRAILPKKKKNAEEEKIDPFNDAEISAILAACRSTEERAFFQFAFATGLRTGEMIALKWAHIDWLNNSIKVQDNIVSGEVGTVEKATKTDTDRDVPLLPAAKDALIAIKPLSALRQIGDYVFINPFDQRRWADSHQVRKRWLKILRDAKVRYRNTYQTRHTFASKLLAAGEQELLVAKLMGHTTVEMIRRHYGKYIQQQNGIALRGNYEAFGFAPIQPQKTTKQA